MKTIRIETEIRADIKKVWKYWTSPEHIVHWNFASKEWHCTSAENNLINGGTFKYNMAAKDGSMAFDFEGVFDKITTYSTIESHLGDGRTLNVKFEKIGNITKVTEFFEPEEINPIEMQQQGWQMILNNFKKHVQAN